MTATVRAVFDGQVFRPEERVDLEPNRRYVLTVEQDSEKGHEDGREAYPLSALNAMAADMGVSDLAARHDWYARRRVADNDEETNGADTSGDETQR